MEPTPPDGAAPALAPWHDRPVRSGQPPLHAASGRSLVITTARGAADMPGGQGSGHLVIAP